MTAKIYDFTRKGSKGVKDLSCVIEVVQSLVNSVNILSEGEQRMALQSLMAMSLMKLRKHLTEEEAAEFLEALHFFLINDIPSLTHNLK